MRLNSRIQFLSSASLVFLAIQIFFGLLGCQSPGGGNPAPSTPPPPPPLYDAKIYHSTLGNFTCHVPRLTHPGDQQVEDSDAAKDSVTFSDDMGRFLRIESVRLPPDSPPLLTADKIGQTLDDFFDGNVFPLFRSVSVNAAVQHREHVTAAGGPALFAVVGIPQGSTLADAGTGQRLDSLRGVLVFSTKGFIYVLQNQEWPSGENIHSGSMDARIARLKADLLEGRRGDDV